MTHKGIVITTDQEIHVRAFAPPLHQTVGATVGGYIEIVHPVGLRHPFVLIVDDEGLLKDYPINPIASVMYGAHFHGHPIVGTAVIMKEGYTADGPDLVGLDDADITELLN